MRACKRRVDRPHPAACDADAGEVQRLPRVSGAGVPSQTRIAAARSLAATEPVCTHAGPARIRWAQLLERAFKIDLECPICGGDLNIRAAIIEAPVIERIHSPYPKFVTLPNQPQWNQQLSASFQRVWHYVGKHSVNPYASLARDGVRRRGRPGSFAAVGRARCP